MAWPGHARASLRSGLTRPFHPQLFIMSVSTPFSLGRGRVVAAVVDSCSSPMRSSVGLYIDDESIIALFRMRL